jgi:TolB protein
MRIEPMKNMDFSYRRPVENGQSRKGEAKALVRVTPLRALVLWMIICALPIPAYAKVYIDIDSPGFRRLPLAVLTLKAAPEDSPCSDRQVEQVVEKVLINDLDVSGYFRTLSPDVFLVERNTVKFYPAKIDYRAWSLIGAEALILLRTTCKGGQIETEAQLLDVLTGKLLTWKRYKSEPAGARRVAHRFADEVAKELTGVPGAFDTRIAYVSNATGSKELYVMDYDGNGPRKLTALKSICLSPAWSPDGRKIVFTSFWRRNPGLYLLDLRGASPLKQMFSRFSPLCSGGAWSADGAWLAFSASLDGNTELFRVPAENGTKPQRLTKNWAIDVSPSWSPDGKYMVFVSDRAGRPDLYILQPENGKIRRLTFEGSYNADPAWSPRGDVIAYVSRVGGTFQIFRIRPDETDRRQLTQGAGDHLTPSWSPDGRLIVFSSNQEGSADLYLMRADGTGVKRLTWDPRDETDPAWSPVRR